MVSKREIRKKLSTLLMSVLLTDELFETLGDVYADNIVNDLIFVCSFLFSAGLLYEVNKLSGIMLAKSESKSKRH